ncbi:MAG: DNA mismatch repair endonuclease MutL [Vicinamibacterales bacterium]
MGKIRLLPVDLANQIAAGEVVERPASVVKELIENALDAGATRISVAVELGGKRLVRVEDDGEGMEPEDARLALERHATSKISRAEDLAAIVTLGFRGEALPSIASVSHLVLRSRRKGSPAGTEVRVNGGVVAGVVEVGMPEGTCVEVADLFYNLPARRKFLKSDSAEAAQVSRIVTQIALAYPEVGFTLTSAGRRAFTCPPVASRRDRFYQVFGERLDLVDVHRETSGMRVTGLAAALAEQGPTRGAQNIFVNRRVVKDRTLAHAVIDAYQVSGIKERSPEVHLFIEMPPDWLDVNVHPTKAEVRFREPSLVHEAVRRALIDALGRSEAPELQLRPSAPQPAPGALEQAIPGILAGGWNVGGGGSRSAVVPAAAEEEKESWTGHAGPPPGQAPSEGRQRIAQLVPIGQVRDTFIVAVDSDGLAIIDQHVAHERVLYERILERLTSGRLDAQRLLEPLLITLPPAGREMLVTHREELERFGFEVEQFGGETVRVLAVPALLTTAEAAAAVKALAEDLEGLDRGARVEEALRRIAATTACHAAVKANARLTTDKMRHIIDELAATFYSTVCPHGRPVMLRLTRREIERNFQRI